LTCAYGIIVGLRGKVFGANASCVLAPVFLSGLQHQSRLPCLAGTQLDPPISLLGISDRFSICMRLSPTATPHLTRRPQTACCWLTLSPLFLSHIHWETEGSVTRRTQHCKFGVVERMTGCLSNALIKLMQALAEVSPLPEALGEQLRDPYARHLQ
jgi:hypothetical protein